MKVCRVSLKTGTGTVVVGELSYSRTGRLARAFFEYEDSFLSRDDAFAIDPKQLPLRRGRLVTPEGFEIFNGIRDASPDGWGRFVLEKSSGRPLDEYDVLLAAGPDRVGALAFDALDGSEAERETSYLDLDGLKELLGFFEHPDVLDPAWKEHLLRGSSLGGARPKATLLHEDRLWLAKFARTSDRFDVVRAEYATMSLARDVGLAVPEVRLIEILGTSIYLIERFDRIRPRAKGESFEPVAFLSALTMLGAHEMEAHGFGYADIAAEIRAQGVNPTSTTKELFRRAAFNVIVNNTDDHLRNHGFLRTERGWVLSPLYDVVPFPEVGTERFLALRLGAEGRRATLSNLCGNSRYFGLSAWEAREEIDRLVEGTRDWSSHFESCGLPRQDLTLLATAFRDPADLW